MNASASARSNDSRAAFVTACTDVLGAAHVLTNAHDTAPFLTDWRRRYTGHACAVLLPADPQQVAAVVRLAREYRVAIVPQGGNTGLAGGATPDDKRRAGGREPQAPEPHPRRRSAQQHDHRRSRRRARRHPGARRTPSSALPAEPRGRRQLHDRRQPRRPTPAARGVLRYGNTRELCLGLEVVTPQGEIWDGLRALRKDNTGYDLRDLYHRRGRHARHHHGGGAEAASGARRAGDGAGRRSRRRTPRSTSSRWRSVTPARC